MSHFINRYALKAYVFLGFATLFWSGNFVVARGIHETIPPFTMAWMRWVIASALIFPFAYSRLKKDWPTISANMPIMLILGGIGVGGFNTLVYKGLNYTTALNGVIIQSGIPILILLLALIIFGERFALSRTLGVVLSLCGMLLIVSKGQLDNLAALHFNQGDLWIIGAVLIWAFYTVMLRKRPAIHPLSFAATTFIISAVINTPLFLYEYFQIRQFELSSAGVLSIAYVSVFPSIISYMLYNRAVEMIGGNRSGPFLHLIPLFGSVLAISFLDERLYLFHAVGFVTILTGIFIAVRERKS